MISDTVAQVALTVFGVVVLVLGGLSILARGRFPQGFKIRGLGMEIETKPIVTCARCATPLTKGGGQ